MATIVREGRNNSPWWGPLAVNILGGLWNDWQERERNKKANALYGEFARQAQELSGGSQDNADLMSPLPSQETGLPEGYNSDGWASAFHKTGTPLTQFDFGTEGLTGVAPNIAREMAQGLTGIPNGNAWANALGGASPLAQLENGVTGFLGTNAGRVAQQGRIPTQMDLMNVWASLLGSKRFGSVDPKAAQEMLTPYLKANEEARQEQRRQEIADAYMNASDGVGRIKTTTAGALRGDIPESLANTIFTQNKPSVNTIDAGGQIFIDRRDPITGMSIGREAVDRTLTPQEIVTNAYNRDKLNADIALHRDTLNENRRQFDITSRQRDEEFQYRSKPKYTLKAMGDGKMYWVDEYGRAVSPATDENGNHMDALPSDMFGSRGDTVSGRDKELLRSNENKITDLQAQRRALETRYKDATTSERKEIQAKIDDIDKKIAELRQENDNYLRQSRTWPRNNSGNGQGVTTLGSNNTSSDISPTPPSGQATPTNGSTEPLSPTARTISKATSYIGDNSADIPKEAVLVNDKGHFYTQEDIDKLAALHYSDKETILNDLINVGYKTPDEFRQGGGTFKVTDKTPRWRTENGDVITYGQEKTLIAQVERGEHPGINTKEELYQALRQKGAKRIGGEQDIPAQRPISGDLSPNMATNTTSTDIQPSLAANTPALNAQSGDISPNTTANVNILGSSGDITPNNSTANNRSILDWLPSFGATPAYADENISNNNELLTADRNSAVEIQSALDNLNGQFGEPMFSLEGMYNTRTIPLSRPNRNTLTDTPFASPVSWQFASNSTPSVTPFASPVSRIQNFNGSPNGLDRNITPTADMATALPVSGRTKPKQALSGRYSSDTKNGGKYANIINRHAKTHNVDPDLIAAIIQQESGGNSSAVSSVGAQGLMQLMPKTARGLGVTDAFDPEQNIAGGTKYVAQMLRRYNGDVEKALWAYNAGPGNADKGRLPAETKKYISSVMARYRRLKGIADPQTKTSKTPKRTRRAKRTVRRRRRTVNRRRR